jgi:hypothetical protein
MENEKQIEKPVDGLVRRAYDEGVKGLSVFSCGGNGVFLTYPAIIPYGNLLGICL